MVEQTWVLERKGKYHRSIDGWGDWSFEQSRRFQSVHEAYEFAQNLAALEMAQLLSGNVHGTIPVKIRAVKIQRENCIHVCEIDGPSEQYVCKDTNAPHEYSLDFNGRTSDINKARIYSPRDLLDAQSHAHRAPVPVKSTEVMTAWTLVEAP